MFFLNYYCAFRKIDYVEVLRLYTCRSFRYLLTTLEGRKSKFALLVAFNVLWYSLQIFFMYSACGTLLRRGGGGGFRLTFRSVFDVISGFHHALLW
jgi:hypothetical protein